MSNTNECIYIFEDGICCRETIVGSFIMNKELYIRHYVACKEHAKIIKERLEKKGFCVRLYTDDNKDNITYDFDKENIQESNFSF